LAGIYTTALEFLALSNQRGKKSLSGHHPCDTQGYTNEDGTLGLMLLQDMDPVPDIEDPSLPDGWMNF